MNAVGVALNVFACVQRCSSTPGQYVWKVMHSSCIPARFHVPYSGIRFAERTTQKYRCTWTDATEELKWLLNPEQSITNRTQLQLCNKVLRVSCISILLPRTFLSRVPSQRRRYMLLNAHLRPKRTEAKLPACSPFFWIHSIKELLTTLPRLTRPSLHSHAWLFVVEKFHAHSTTLNKQLRIWSIHKSSPTFRSHWLIAGRWCTQIRKYVLKCVVLCTTMCADERAFLKSHANLY